MRSVEPQSTRVAAPSIRPLLGRSGRDYRLPVAGALVVALLGLALAWLWQKTQSLNPEDHSHLDGALRELRSLDRTINQDVVRARYKLIPSYDSVLLSYRRVEELELAIATPPRFLDEEAQQRLAQAVNDYREAVTIKQRLIERVKYRAADLRDLLDYLPGAGAALASAASHSGDSDLAEQVNHVLQMLLLYNLTSDEQYAPVIGLRLGLLAAASERADSPSVRRRLRTLITSVNRLLKVKPAVDALLLQIFDQPIIQHENEVARIYYDAYASAERAAKRYRVVLYALCIALVLVVGYGVRRLQHTARALAASNERLEEHVVERTRELRAVLDNVEQALFTVDLEGRLARERSAVLDAWFPHAAVGAFLWDVLAPVDPAAASWLEVGWEQLREGILPPSVAFSQLPAALTSVTTGRRYRIDYRPIGEPSRPDECLIVISDVTLEVERERREAEQQEHLMLFQHIMIDGASFEEAFAEMDRLIHEVSGRRRPRRDVLLRGLHTIKGNAAMYGLVSLSALCHALETKLIDGAKDLDAVDLEQLTEVWATLADKVGVLMGMAARDRLEITHGDLAQVEEAVSAGCSAAEILQCVRYLKRDPVERRLGRLADQARQLAQRLNKGDIEVRIAANGVRLDSRRWAPFWAAMVHLVRNALDHGIEPLAERQAAGKSPRGCLSLATRDVDGQIVIELGDDGRGVDWEAVRAKARAQGWASDTQQDLQAALWRGGLSTRAEASEISGRGAGLAACHSACREMGGTMSVTTVHGVGTTFRFAIPGDDAVLPRLTSAA